MKTRTFLALNVFLAFGLAGGVAAQTEGNHLWPTFSVAVGSCQVSSDDQIHIEGTLERRGQDLDLGRDLGLPDRDRRHGPPNRRDGRARLQADVHRSDLRLDMGHGHCLSTQ
ncbi:MAG: hypothetical protein ABIV06_03065 [Thermoanaerobaculia bacterium]